MPYSEDPELDQLINETKSLFNEQNSFVQPSNLTGSTEYQSPIKDIYYNSGDFSFSATDPRHPSGHLGVDLRAAAGTPVYSLTDGIVTNVGTNPKGGNIINIQHPNNVSSYYAHLSTAKVQKGDKVDKNTIIGTVGNTGNASVTWPHLHLQIWANGQIQNPAKFFFVPKFTNVDKSKENWWNSTEAKQEAVSFNMKDHLSSRQASFANQINKLVKMANYYLLRSL